MQGFSGAQQVNGDWEDDGAARIVAKVFKQTHTFQIVNFFGRHHREIAEILVRRLGWGFASTEHVVN